MTSEEVATLILSHQIDRLIAKLEDTALPTWPIKASEFTGFGRSALESRGETLTLHKQWSE